jgi:hypothetical protein
MSVTAGTTNRTNLTNEQGNLVQAIVANPDLLKTVLTEIYDYLDANWGDYNSHKTSAVLAHPDGSVTTAKIADLAVIASKIADLSIIAGKLADGAVTTSKIADNSITYSKVATGAFDIRYYTQSQTEDRIASAYANDRFIDGGSFLDNYNGNLTGIDGGVF